MLFLLIYFSAAELGSLPLSPWGRGWLGQRPSRERGMKRGQAKQLRSRMTDAELRLWYRLRAHRYQGLKFKRQAPYIVDFICFDHKLVVEVDGGKHAERESDRRRDDWLRHEEYRVMRFWNDDALKRTDSVLDQILTELTLSGKTPLPARFARHPLPQGERGTQHRR